jgi:putative peptide zinc metalloprotease protein
VCQYLRVPVREAGIGLMLYLMPVGYVDRTDAYRVRERRSRAFLSLAGPLNDQIWFGATAVVAVTVPGETGDLAYSLLFFQALLTVANLNPLTPSDGYHAVSAVAGQVNVRGQALAYLTHRLLRIPLTPLMVAASPRRRRFYLVYAIACAAFVALLAFGLVRTGLAVSAVLS